MTHHHAHNCHNELTLNSLNHLLRYLERRRSPCLPASADTASSSCGSFWATLRGLAFICWSIIFCTGTGIRGNRVENHSSFVRKERSISPMVITQPPPAFTSSSYSHTVGKSHRKTQSAHVGRTRVNLIAFSTKTICDDQVLNLHLCSSSLISHINQMCLAFQIDNSK